LLKKRRLFRRGRFIRGSDVVIDWIHRGLTPKAATMGAAFDDRATLKLSIISAAVSSGEEPGGQVPFSAEFILPRSVEKTGLCAVRRHQCRTSRDRPEELQGKPGTTVFCRKNAWMTEELLRSDVWPRMWQTNDHTPVPPHHLGGGLVDVYRTATRHQARLHLVEQPRAYAKTASSVWTTISRPSPAAGATEHLRGKILRPYR
jgi:hypothetical protein